MTTDGQDDHVTMESKSEQVDAVVSLQDPPKDQMKNGTQRFTASKGKWWMQYVLSACIMWMMPTTCISS